MEMRSGYGNEVMDVEMRSGCGNEVKDMGIRSRMWYRI